MTLSIIKDINIASTHYYQSNDTLTLQKDGQQTSMISLLAGIRLSLLSTQLNQAFPRFPKLPMEGLTFSLMAIPCFIQPLANWYLTACSNATFTGAEYIKKTCQLIKKLEGVGKGITNAFQHADKVVNIACLVSYVALIALGFHASGIIGLSGLFLLALKRYGHLPLLVDQNILYISKILSIATPFLIQASIVTRILLLLLSVYDIVSFVLSFNLVNKYLPEEIKNPLSGWHKCSESKNYHQFDSIQLSTNPSHIYTHHLFIAPPNESENRSIEELFNALKNRIKTENIALTCEEEKGLEKLKNGIVRGRFEDTPPANFSKFQEILSLLIQKILQDQDKHHLLLKKFAEVGNSCSEGWPSQATELLIGSTIESQVHWQLARQRGAILHAYFQKLAIELKKDKSPIDFSAVGGNNNVHFVNNIHSGLWHHFRSYEGEIHLQLNPPSLLTKIAVRYWLTKNVSDLLETISMFESNPNFSLKLFINFFYFVVHQTNLHPAFATALFILYKGALTEIRNYFTNPDLMIDRIYDAIKDKDITWNVVSGWLHKISNKDESFEILDETNYYKNGGYNRKWVRVGNDQSPHELTKEAVKLLLWDLDILTSPS